MQDGGLGLGLTQVTAPDAPSDIPTAPADAPTLNISSVSTTSASSNNNDRAGLLEAIQNKGVIKLRSKAERDALLANTATKKPATQQVSVRQRATQASNGGNMMSQPNPFVEVDLGQFKQQVDTADKDGVQILKFQRTQIDSYIRLLSKL